MPQVLPIVGPAPVQTTLTDGAANDTVADAVRRFLPPAYKNKPGWEALIASLAAGDEFVRTNVYKAFNQLFLSSATGNYLIERAADQGIDYPENAGITEELFRDLAVLLSNDRQIVKSLLGILEVFYGFDSTHARLESAAEPFDLQAGDTISFVVDDRNTVTATIRSGDFVDINAATAIEVAAVLSRAFRDSKNEAFAVAKAIDGQNKVVVYSGAVGLLGSLTCVGGFANLALQFPTMVTWVDTYAGNQWNRLRVSLDEFRLTWTQVRAPGNLNEVQAGDYVLLNPAADNSLRGSYEVTKVVIDADPATGSYANRSYFSIKPTDSFPYNTIGAPNTAFNSTAGEIVFFHKARQTVVQNPNAAFVAQHQPTTGVDIILPVTTQAVGRAYNAAAYLHDTVSIPVADVWRLASSLLVVTTVPHGLTTGQTVELEGVAGSSGPPPPPLGSSNPAGGWNQSGQITVINATRFSMAVNNSGYSIGHGSGGFVIPMTAPAGDAIGPYVYDSTGVSITATQTTTTTPLAANRGVSTLPVASTAGFPTGECWIVVGFANSYEFGPIRCLGAIDGSNLAIDRSYIFPFEVPSGASVILLNSKGVYVPADGADAFILTDSSAGRIAAEAFIDETKAAGVQANKVVVYPGDRGLGGEGDPTSGIHLSDKVEIWAGDDVDAAVEAAHNA